METSIDSRRRIAIIDSNSIDSYIANKVVEIGNKFIKEKGFFTLVLPGGSTPKPVIKYLTSQCRDKLDWDKVHLLWGDERAVGPDHQDSNFKMAMDNGFKDLIPDQSIHRIKGESADLDLAAKEYESIVKRYFPLDLIILGMGDDGHTASIFPNTKAVDEKDRLVMANFVKEKNSNRLTFSMTAINSTKHIIVLVLGEKKKKTIKLALQKENSDHIVAHKIGTENSPALWITDQNIF